jgi:NAD+--asparagine ADP-ribosyltransferase
MPALSRSTLLLTSLFSLSVFCLPAHALDCGGSCNASNASAVMSEGVGLIVAGSLSVVGGSAVLVIEAVEKTDDAIILVVKTGSEVGKASANAASTVGKASIKLTGKAVKKLGFVAGQTLEISAVTTGYFLVYSGKAVAFIPNEVGQALLSHEKVSHEKVSQEQHSGEKSKP